MRRVVTTTTIPDRKFRKAIGVSRDAVLMITDDGVEAQPSEGAGKRTVIGRKALSRRLGVKLAGAVIDWDHSRGGDNAAFRFTTVQDDRTGYVS